MEQAIECNDSAFYGGQNEGNEHQLHAANLFMNGVSMQKKKPSSNVVFEASLLELPSRITCNYYAKFYFLYGRCYSPSFRSF